MVLVNLIDFKIFQIKINVDMMDMIECLSVTWQKKTKSILDTLQKISTFQEHRMSVPFLLTQKINNTKSSDDQDTILGIWPFYEKK